DREPLLRARQLEIGGRVRLQDTLLAEPAEVALHGDEFRALRGDAERLVVGAAEAPQVALVALQDRARNLRRLSKPALLGPAQKGLHFLPAAGHGRGRPV